MEKSVIAEARTESLADVPATIDQLWSNAERSAAPLPASRWRFELATAVWEIAANVVYHAYPTDAEDRPMRLHLRLYSNRAEALFTDQGAIYSPSDESSSFDADLDLPERGMGLLIARAAVDRMSYRRTPDGKNVWRLVKRLV